MKLKATILGLFAVFASGVFIACDTDPEALVIQSITPKWADKGEEYYANLRAWKATRPEFGFGWFSGSTDKASLMGSMRNIPDSIGIISLWGGVHPETSSVQAEELHHYQTVCGTKILSTHLLESIPFPLTEDGSKTTEQLLAEQWGWEGDIRPSTTNGDMSVVPTPAQEAAIRKFAKYLADDVIARGLDGMDIDHEPRVAGGTKPFMINGYPYRMKPFVEELGKYFGPKSGTGRLLVVDGEYQYYLLPELGEYFDYFIAQAYSSGTSPTVANLDSRMNALFNAFPAIPKKELAAKFIITENFESYAANGGNMVTPRDGSAQVPACINMAMWQPIVDGDTVRKGGAGTYHMEYEFNVYKDYKWLREMIHIMGENNK